MDYPFIQGISDIQQTQVMTGSRTTIPFSPRGNGLIFNLHQEVDLLHENLGLESQSSNQQQSKQAYYSHKEYVEKILNSWGMKIGYLPQSYQNNLTINCLLQIIAQRFNDQENREQLKKSLSQTVFQRNKFQRLLQQQKLQNTQKNKTIGRLQNTIAQFKAKIKQIEQVTRKQKEDDKKIIFMLQSKNQQILHEVKKRQQQSNKLKQQMKKNVGQKGAPKNITFQVYEVGQKQKCDSDSINDRLQTLNQKHQNQRKHFMKQNLLLRQKIYDIRQQIVKFAEWIDQNIFRQGGANYKNKLLVNHNLLFKKQSIVNEFNQILNDARNGIQQLIDFQQKNQQKQRISLQARQTLKPRSSEYIQNYQQQNMSPNKIQKSYADFKKVQPRSTIPSQKKGQSAVKQKTRQTTPKRYMALKKPSITQRQKIQPQFIQEQSEISIISHVSSKDIVCENEKFDKWDLLFNHD